MDLKWLEDFISLTEIGNFSRTAQVRNTTQSALSRRMQSLEEWAGVSLIDRRNQPICLTVSGKVFFRYAEEIVKQAYLAKAESHTYGGQFDAPITFIMQYSISRSFFSRWLAKIEPELEPFNVKVCVDNRNACINELESENADFMLLYDHSSLPASYSPTSSMLKTHAGQTKALAVSIPDSQGGPKFQLPGSADNPLPFLRFSAEATIGSLVEVSIASMAQKSHLRTCYESANADCLLEAALAGKGLAMLPYCIAKNDLDAGNLVYAGGSSTGHNSIENTNIMMCRRRNPMDAKREELWRIALKTSLIDEI